jgi:hypothetical protein
MCPATSARRRLIACISDGGAGQSGNGPTLHVTLALADGLDCTITNQR